MTQQEYIEAIFNLEQEARNAKRTNATQLELLEAKHRENVQNEMDRYNIAVRRQKAEYAEKVDTLHRRMAEVKMQRAASRAEEEKAAAVIGCSTDEMS